MNEPEQPEPEKAKKEVNDGRPWLAIFLNEDESMKVTGHIQDKLLAYGLLESAKDAIRRSIDKKSQIERVNNSGGLIQFLRNGRK